MAVQTLISILIPVRNEAEYIVACLNGVFNFELGTDVNIEVLVLDGNSTDNTVNIIKNNFADSRLKVINNPDQYPSNALNLGISLAKGEYIMRLDAHSEYPRTYLVDLLETIMRTNADNVGGVCITLPGSDSLGGRIVQAISTHAFGVGDSSFRTGNMEGIVDTVPFGFFRKDLFDRIGHFDEQLIRAQDYEFNSRIRREGGVIWLNSKIKIRYFNQKKYSSFLKKLFMWDGPYNAYMWFLHPYTFRFRHAVAPIFSLSFLIGIVVMIFSSAVTYLVLTVAAFYILLSLVASIQQARRYGWYRLVLFLPLAFFLYHFCYGLGTLKGGIRLLFGVAPVRRSK